MIANDWKIIYTKYEGVAKRAIQLLSKEAGALMIREPNVYRIQVLPCEKEGCAISKNAFFIGLYNDSATIRRYVSEDEVPKDGFLVKVIDNPEDAEGRFVLLTAHTEIELFYALVSFLDDYIPACAPIYSSNPMPDLIFDKPLRKYSYSEKPDNKTRSIFTWGHPINDYRAYLDNMARLKLNELILWNDYIPLNIDEIIDYAHSYGIRIVLGYSWGWKEIGNKTAEISDEKIEEVKKIAIGEYRENYAHVACDGIYFQSFTERKEESVGGKLISEIVVDMVNEIAEEIWRITPNQRIIFGLHATSVKNRLDNIARVHPKMEIMWEDCGEFPFNYASSVKNEAEYEETLRFVDEILKLRGGKGVGLVMKGSMMLDWTKVVRQLGPFVMGENSRRIAAHDRHIRANAWKIYSANWIESGARAQEMLKFIKEHKKEEIDICVAGTFDGGIYLPLALYAEMFRCADGDYQATLRRVMRKNCLTVD